MEKQITRATAQDTQLLTRWTRAALTRLDALTPVWLPLDSHSVLGRGVVGPGLEVAAYLAPGAAAIFALAAAGVHANVITAFVAVYTAAVPVFLFVKHHNGGATALRATQTVGAILFAAAAFGPILNALDAGAPLLPAAGIGLAAALLLHGAWDLVEPARRAWAARTVTPKRAPADPAIMTPPVPGYDSPIQPFDFEKRLKSHRLSAKSS